MARVWQEVRHQNPVYGRRCAIDSQGVVGNEPPIDKVWLKVCDSWPWCGRRCAIVDQGEAGGVSSIARVWWEVRHSWPRCGGWAINNQGVATGVTQLTRV